MPHRKRSINRVQREVSTIDDQEPVSNIRPMEEVVDASVSQNRFETLLLGAFAGLALLLAAVGIYGVMSYSVERRTQEIGIRIALGAGWADVLREVAREGLGSALAGVGIGLLASLWLTRLLARFLFGVKSADVVTFAGVALLLMAVACVACYVP